MFEIALEQLKTKHKQLIFFFAFFFIINSVVDYLNIPYSNMIAEYGLYLVIINISLNIIMSTLTAIMLTLSIINVSLKGSETKSSNLGFISVLFSVILKVVKWSTLLLIIIGGLYFTKYEINKPCKVKS